MPKFTGPERNLIQGIVASLIIKRIPNSQIIKEVSSQTKKSISAKSLYNIRQRIKKESSKWYSQLRQGEYEYIHEFKERINEIVDLQRRHYQIIEDNKKNPSVQQASLAALHKLNVTLSNYYDIVPYLTATGQRQTQEEARRQRIEAASHTRMDIIENCKCRPNGGFALQHNKCLYCLHSWCPKAAGQDCCPNPQCAHGIMGCKFQPYDENYTWIKCSCGMWFQRTEILDAHLTVYPHNSNSNGTT